MKAFQIWFILSLFVITSCVQEDYFGLSPYGNIKVFEVSNQSSTSIIDNSNFTIQVEVAAGVNLSKIAVQKIELSSFATATIHTGDTIDLNNEIITQVTAEDGSVHTWTITATTSSSTPQLDNYQLNDWYMTSDGYYEPGVSANATIWGTGNPGSNLLNRIATTRVEITSGNYAAQLETLDNGILGTTFGAPIAAGSLFTGVFNMSNLDPTDPEAAIDFGTLFSARPNKFKFKYSYEPGTDNKDKDGNSLTYPDACDIYILLEIRDGNQVQRLATAWFRSSDLVSTLTEIEIPFVYGELDASYPQYMFPTDHDFVAADIANYTLPTHLTFVASSSYDGANFAGAIGSMLIIDDVELIYE